jgi:hypothetical protein
MCVTRCPAYVLRLIIKRYNFLLCAARVAWICAIRQLVRYRYVFCMLCIFSVFLLYASMLKRYGGNARMYAEDEAKKMKVMTWVMRNEDDSRKYRNSLVPIYNPNSPALVGEVKVCPLYFIYIQCFPCHKFCYITG